MVDSTSVRDWEIAEYLHFLHRNHNCSDVVILNAGLSKLFELAVVTGFHLALNGYGR